MKQRCTVLFIALLVFSVPAWAQITFSSWGRVVITPYATSGDFSSVSAATSTWSDQPYISFSANGKAPSGNIGFNIDFDFGYNVLNGNYNIVGDNAKAWIYPLGLALPNYNMLKLVAGRFYEDELRGKIGATEFGSWLLPNGSKDEDYIFTRFRATAGAYARLEPLKWLDSPWNGLTMHMAFGSNAIGANGNGLRAILNLFNNEANKTEGSDTQYKEGTDVYDGDRNTSAKDVYKAGQYAIAYRVPDVGLARFQFIGSNLNVRRLKSIADAGIEDTEKQLVIGLENKGSATLSADTIEFAFLYDGLEGLKVDAGFKLPLEYKTRIAFTAYPDTFYPPEVSTVTGEHNTPKGSEYIVQLPMVIALGANWTPSFLPQLNIMSRFDISFGGKIQKVKTAISGNDFSVENGFIFNAWLVPSYKIIPNLLTLGIDLGMDIHGEDKLVMDRSVPASELTKVSQYTDFGFAGWVEVQVGGGKVRTGVVVMMPGSLRFKSDVRNKVTPKFTTDPVVSFPISITYSF